MIKFTKPLPTIISSPINTTNSAKKTIVSPTSNRIKTTIHIYETTFDPSKDHTSPLKPAKAHIKRCLNSDNPNMDEDSIRRHTPAVITRCYVPLTCWTEVAISIRIRTRTHDCRDNISVAIIISRRTSISHYYSIVSC